MIICADAATTLLADSAEPLKSGVRIEANAGVCVLRRLCGRPALAVAGLVHGQAAVVGAGDCHVLQHLRRAGSRGKESQQRQLLDHQYEGAVQRRQWGFRALPQH